MSNPPTLITKEQNAKSIEGDIMESIRSKEINEVNEHFVTAEAVEASTHDLVSSIENSFIRLKANLIYNREQLEIRSHSTLERLQKVQQMINDCLTRLQNCGINKLEQPPDNSHHYPVQANIYDKISNQQQLSTALDEF